MAGTTIGAMAVRLYLDDKGFQTGLKNAESNVSGFGGKIDNVAGKIGSVLTTAFAAATAAVAGFGAATAVTGAKFEQEITKVSAIAVDGQANIGALTDKARELGAQTQFSATQAANAMQDFARAGMSANEIIDASGPALMLAGAAGADMAQATSLMSATLAQFNLHSSQASRISDVFNQTLKSSLFDMSSLTEAMKYAGTTGRAFGMTLEETTASVAMFRNLGLEGSMAGTAFRMAMAKAAKVTSAGKKILDNYNLSVQDINPELHTFGEIMETVGQAGVSTTEMIELFGVKAGLNVAAVAAQFATGETQFHSLLETLENSAGSASSTYNEMGQTVAFQFQVVKSATEELMLSVFDTYKGPLQELLRELSSLIQHTAGVFANASGTMEAGFGGIIKEITEYMKTNREAIAQGFVAFANSVVEVTQLMASLIPHLSTVAKLMATIWVANLVRTTVLAVQAFHAAVVLSSGGVRGLMATITAATGGLYALVAVIGTVVAMVAAFAVESAIAAAEANNFATAQGRVAAAAKAAAEAQKEAVDAAVASGSAWARQTELNMAGQDGLTNSVRTALTNIYELAEAEALAGVEAGTHIQTMLDGEQVIMSIADAYTLMGSEMEEASEVQQGLVDTMNDQQDAMDSAEHDVRDLERAYRRYSKQAEGMGADHIAFAQHLKPLVDNMEDYHVVLGVARAKVAELTAQQDALGAATVAASHLMAVANAEQEAMNVEVEVKAKKRSSGGVSRTKKALDARVKLTESWAKKVEDIYANEAEAGRLAMDRALKDVADMFAAELKLYRGNAKKRGQLLEAQEQLESQVRATFRVAETRESNDHERELRDQLLAAKLKAKDDEMAILMNANASELVETYNSFNDELALYEEGTRAYLNVVNRRKTSVNLVEERHQVEGNARRTQAVAAVNAQIEALEVSAAQTRGSRLVTIEVARGAAMAAAEKGTAAQRLAINEHYDRLIVESKRTITDEINGIVGHQSDEAERLEKRAARAIGKTRKQFLNDEAARVRKREALERELADKLVQYSDATEEEKAAITDYYNGEIEASDAESGEERKGMALQVLADIGAAAVAAAKMAVSGMVSIVSSAAGALTSVFSAMTGGFSFSISEGMDAVGAAAEEHATALEDLQTAVSEGEISPADYEAALAELGDFDAAAAASDWVDEIIEGALSFVDMLVEAAPVMIERLASELPTLIIKVAEAIPELVQGIADNLPLILDALVDGIPILLAGIVEAIPAIVDAVVYFFETSLPDLLEMLGPIVSDLIATLVEAMPRVVDAAMSALPDLISFIVDAVVQLVSSIPEIVGVILNAIPTIITSLLEGLDDIVLAIFEMIPDLIMTIIAAIPAIVIALVEGLLNIVVTIAEQVPLLIAAIVEMLPVLIEELLSMIAPLITAIIEAIPAIIFGFIDGLDDIIIAVIGAIPQIVVSIISALPEIVVALVKGIFLELIPMLPMIVYELIKALIVGLYEGIKSFVSFFGDVFKAAFEAIGGFIKDLFSGGGSDGEGKGGKVGDAWDTIKGWFGGYSGIDYVPSNRLVTVHAGEAVLTREQNESRMRGGIGGLTASQATAGAGMAGGGGSPPVDIAIMAEGRLLDAVQVTAMDRGHAPKLESKLKRASGVKVGFNRGRFDRYGRG